MRFVLDVALMVLAAGAAALAAPSDLISQGKWFAISFPLLALISLHARANPDDRLPGSQLETAGYVLSSVSLAAMLALALDTLFGGTHPLVLALRLWVFTVVYLSLGRVVLLSIRRRRIRTHGEALPTLIVGAGSVGEHLVRRLMADPTYGLVPIGFLDSSTDASAAAESRPDGTVEPASVPVLGSPDELTATVQQTGARHVILAFSTEPDHVLVEKVHQCHELGVEVSLVPRLYEAVNERTTLNHVGGMPLVGLRPVNPRGWQFAVKHTFDRVLAVCALLALSPLLLAIAVAVRLSSPGPILFRQRRVGRDGHSFDLLKFRTMRALRPAGDGFAPPDGCAPGGIEGEDRRTTVGRLLRGSSLDELPQLINVLRGDMSIVGPRPERPEFVERFSVEVARYQDRHRVKSGITGWAQVSGLRGQTSIADRVEWDNFYIQNWSLRLDVRIILLTVAEILRFRG